MNAANDSADADASSALETMRQQLRQRLARLEGFLKADAANNPLLIDAYETALACGEWERAQTHLQQGKALAQDVLGWQLREGDFWLAQQQYDQAREVLEKLATAPSDNAAFADVLLHNLAFIDFRQGRPEACVERLRQRMTLDPSDRQSPGTVPLSNQALQCLWLRAQHHAGAVDAAYEWALQSEQAGQLAPAAAGIAALVAIDANQLQAAQRWCAQALAQDNANPQVETLVAHGTLALGRQDAALALQAAEAALQRHPRDGRSWSLKAFAQMLAQNLPAALGSFDNAVQFMPGHIGTWIGRGWVQMLQGALDAARQSFEAALALDRNFGESHGGLAVVLALQGQREAAEEHAEIAMRLDRGNLSGQFAQAILRGEVRDQESLLKLARRILGRLGI